MAMNTSRKSFLLTVWEGGGNVPPMLAVARRLDAAGHDVRIMSDHCNRPESEATGARFVPYTTAPSRRDKSAATDIIRDYEASTPEEGMGRVIDNVMCGPALAYARDVLAELDREPAHAVISTDLLFGPMIAAEKSHTPLAVLGGNISLFPMPGVPPMGPGLLPAKTDEQRALHAAIADGSRALFNRGLPALNAARRTLALAPLSHVFDQVEVASRIVHATARAFDFAPDEVPEEMVYVGPLLDDPSVKETWRSPFARDDGRPLVLVSFSTTFQNQGDAVRRAIEAVANLPVRALVTLGPALEASAFRAPDNVVLCARAPHQAVMEQAAAAVSHGGHGTVIRALANGVPLLVMPMGRDQNDNATRVVARGAGESLDPRAAADQIREALSRVVFELSYRRAAQALKAAIAEEMANSPLLQVLEEVASARPFVQRDNAA